MNNNKSDVKTVKIEATTPPRFFVFPKGETDPHGRSLYGYVTGGLQEGTRDRYSGVTFYTDGSCFKMIVESPDMTETEVEGEVFFLQLSQECTDGE